MILSLHKLQEIADLVTFTEEIFKNAIDILIITKWDKSLLQNVLVFLLQMREFYYKLRQFYFKVR